MRYFTRRGLAPLLVGIAVGLSTPVSAAQLYGVSGDGAPVNPESFFRVSTVDASTTLIQALGNGNDGESIAFNPNDGLMYHWSGFSTTGNSIMETINLTDQTVTNIPTNVTAYDPREVFGSTFDPSTGNFLFTDINRNLGSVTPGGVFSVIGGLPCFFCRGLAFNGGTLYSGERESDQLYAINPATGGGLSQVTVTLAGFTVEGINGLSTDPGTGILYALLKTEVGKVGRRLATLNPVTGVATDIGPLPDGFANIEFAVVTGLDHFLFYQLKVVDRLRSGLFERRPITLADQFDKEGEVRHFLAERVMQLGNPANKNDEGIRDPETHLVAYRIIPNLLKNVSQEQSQVYKKLLPPVTVTNQFGEATLEVWDPPGRLLVPSTKSLDGPVDPPDTLRVEHFQCYGIYESWGFEKQVVSVVDQFEDPKDITLLWPTHLCNPTDKNGEGITNESQHLVCYEIASARDSRSGYDYPQEGRKVYTNNQFGPLEGQALDETELCVPSGKTLVMEEP